MKYRNGIIIVLVIAIAAAYVFMRAGKKSSLQVPAAPAAESAAPAEQFAGPYDNYPQSCETSTGTDKAASTESGSYFGRFYSDGKRQSGKFALTFDDGPGSTTPELLQVLKKHNVKATFFMLGSAVDRYPKYAAAVAEAGHLLGNHTYTHANFNKKPEDVREQSMGDEICRTETAVSSATGTVPYFLRSPYGLSSQWIRDLAAKKGYVMVNWSCGADWLFHPREQILKQYLDNLHSGAVFLMHDGGSNKRETTVWLAQRILAEAEKRGLKCVRLDELLGIDLARLEKDRAALSGCCSCKNH